MAVFLSVAPHPDDEVLGAGAVCLELLAHGHEVHVVCASLGRSEEHERRAAEAEAAAARAGWVLHVPDEPVAMSAGDDLDAAEHRLTGVVAEWVERLGADVVIGPGPHDAHHGHEVVARAIAAAGHCREGLRWWAWEVWGHLVVANLVLPYDEAVLDQAMDVLDRYVGELARTDYGEALVGAAMVGSALGAERVFGFGSVRPWEEPHAAVLSEAVVEAGGWSHTKGRILDPADPLRGEVDHDRSAAWLTSSSPSQRS